MEALFTSLHEDIQAVKHEVTQDLWEIRRDLAEMGNRVSTLEEKETGRGEERRVNTCSKKSYACKNNKQHYRPTQKALRTTHTGITFAFVGHRVGPKAQTLQTM
ncbi:hypothetical protein NDU88_010027 [Pleurodeles waltl]|uniref:Uncharacterized protein n=1 Tax=Pleurodeles waltl TaxID=8319 RepID=A0AAV7PTZ9_PLEWA|nr:hypothetical protein NDU88_010027 [Pleurodeles waltl]